MIPYHQQKRIKNFSVFYHKNQNPNFPFFIGGGKGCLCCGWGNGSALEKNLVLRRGWKTMIGEWRHDYDFEDQWLAKNKTSFHFSLSAVSKFLFNTFLRKDSKASSTNFMGGLNDWDKCGWLVRCASGMVRDQRVRKW